MRPNISHLYPFNASWAVKKSGSQLSKAEHKLLLSMCINKRLNGFIFRTSILCTTGSNIRYNDLSVLYNTCKICR